MELLILIVHLVAFSYGKSFTYFLLVFGNVYFGWSKEMKRVDVIYANEQLLTKLSNPFFSSIVFYQWDYLQILTKTRRFA